MNRGRNSDTYTYKLSIKLGMYIAVLISIVMLAATTASFLIDLTVPIRSVASGDLPAPWGSLFGVFVSLVLFMMFSNIYPSVQISDENVGIQVFLLWWVYIPWQDVLEVRNSLVGRSGVQLVIRPYRK